MKLELQVCSLESAKKLKELGVKQESLFFWFHRWEGSSMKDAGKNFIQNIDYETENSRIVASAFTVAELGELMKTSIDEKGVHSEWNYIWKKWTCYLIDMNCDTESQEDGDTEAECRAKMLIYLLSNKLISTE